MPGTGVGWRGHTGEGEGKALPSWSLLSSRGSQTKNEGANQGGREHRRGDCRKDGVGLLLKQGVRKGPSQGVPELRIKCTRSAGPGVEGRGVGSKCKGPKVGKVLRSFVYLSAPRRA